MKRRSVIILLLAVSLAGCQVVAHLRSYLKGENEVLNVLDTLGVDNPSMRSFGAYHRVISDSLA